MLVKPLVTSLVQPLVTPLVAPFQRFFTTLASAGSQHFTIPTVTLTGDFEIEWTDTISDDVNTFSIVGDSAGTDSIQSRPSGVIRIRIAASTVAFSTGNVTKDGKLHTRSIKLVGNDFIYTEDGTIVQTITDATAAANSFSVDAIGQNNGANFIDGIIANVKITDAGTLIRKYNIDEDWVGPSTVLRDSSGNGQNGTAVNITDADAELFTRQTDGDFLGVERVVNGGFNTDTNWTKDVGWSITGGKLDASSATQFSGAEQTTVNSLEVGRYRYSFDVDSISAGTTNLRIGSDFSEPVDVSASGTFSGDMTSDAMDSLIRLASTSVTALTATMDNVSVKRLLEVA